MSGSEEEQVLPAEFALGLLDPADDGAARARMREDPAFAADVGRWQAHAAELFAGTEATPSPALWQRIAERLPANDVGTSPAPLDAGGDRARPWKLATLAASLVAATFGVFALQPRPERVVVRIKPVPAPAVRPVVAVLTGADERSAAAISIDRASGELTLAPARLDLGRKVPELWVIPAGGKPHALGVVSASLSGAIRPPRAVLALVRPGATLAISEEPAGGSPTGQPTGRVVLAATVGAGTPAG